MFDEEVRFSLVNIHKERLDPALTKLYKTLSIIGGGIAGYLTFKHGLDFNQLYSALFGIPVGIAVGSQSLNVVRAIRKSRLEEKVKTNLEIEGTKKHASFEYRGNLLDCIIEPEHETNGKIFYMNVSDGVIIEPAFSYQPSRKSLGFKFAVHRHEEISGGMSKFFGSIGISIGKIERDSEGEEWKRGAEEEDKKSKGPFYKRLSKELVKQLGGKDNYTLGFEIDSEAIYVHLRYKGDDFDSHLEEFGKLASKVVNSASGFKRRENFNEEEED